NREIQASGAAGSRSARRGSGVIKNAPIVPRPYDKRAGTIACGSRPSERLGRCCRRGTSDGRKAKGRNQRKIRRGEQANRRSFTGTGSGARPIERDEGNGATGAGASDREQRFETETCECGKKCAEAW